MGVPFVTASCSSNSPDNPGGETGGLGSCLGGRPWKATSTRVELRSFGFFQGSSGYESDRSALSAAQLSALDAMCIIPTPTGPGGADFTTYAIEIADADGSVATYPAGGDAGVPSH